MIYETARIKLRPLKAEDSAISCAWRNDPEVRDFALGYRYPVTTAMEQAWYTKAMAGDNKDVYFAIEDAASGAFIGIVSLVQVDLISANACFGIIIGDKPYQGGGRGRDAMDMMLNYGFSMLGLHRVYLHVPAYNERAYSLYSSAGFKVEGVMREHVFLNGGYHDVNVMGLLKADVEARRG
jgi:RimJ/RimL family protein N-acetyltransferase